MSMSNSTCFTLTDSIACPNLNGFNILPSIHFNDSISFDRYILNQPLSLMERMRNTNQDIRSSSISNNNDNPSMSAGCSNWDKEDIRFHISTLCFYTLEMGNCTQPRKSPSLCQDSCLAFFNSIHSSIRNPDICPPTDHQEILDERKSILDLTSTSFLSNQNYQNNNFSRFCSRMPTTDCTPGTPSEKTLCGFNSTQKTLDFCSQSSNSASVCCNEFTEIVSRTMMLELDPPQKEIWVNASLAIAAIIFIILAYWGWLKISASKRYRDWKSQRAQSKSQNRSLVRSLFFLGDQNHEKISSSIPSPSSSSLPLSRSSSLTHLIDKNQDHFSLTTNSNEKDPQSSLQNISSPHDYRFVQIVHTSQDSEYENVVANSNENEFAHQSILNLYMEPRPLTFNFTDPKVNQSSSQITYSHLDETVEDINKGNHIHQRQETLDYSNPSLHHETCFVHQPHVVQQHNRTDEKGIHYNSDVDDEDHEEYL